MPPAVRSSVVHLGGRLRHAGRRVLHAAHQQAQLFHRVVHRVGNGAGDVFRHRGFLRQITFRQPTAVRSSNAKWRPGWRRSRAWLPAPGARRRVAGFSRRLTAGCPAAERANTDTAPAARTNLPAPAQQIALRPDRSARTACSAGLPAGGAGFAVGNDGGLRFTRQTPDPAGCPEWRPPGYGSVRTSLIRAWALAGLRVLVADRRATPGCHPAGLGNFLEGSSSPCPAGTRPQGSRLPSVWNFVGRLADTLGQHHQLACGRNFSRGRFAAA